MGRIIVAEENTFSYLKKVSESNIFTTGLIIGQCSQSRDYVVLLARTPEQADETKSEGERQIQSLSDIQESWIADHAKHVTRMLPGGMWVLGAFICSPSDVFIDALAQARLKSILYQMKKLLATECLLEANSPSNEKLLLHFNTSAQVYTCKTLDVNATSSTFKAADWKFQKNITKWYQICCNFDLDEPSRGGNTTFPLKIQLKQVLDQVNNNMAGALITLDGDVRQENESLESLAGKRRKSKSQGQKIAEMEPKKEKESFEASIFVPFGESSTDPDLVVKNCDVELQLMGVVSSQVFLNQKATVAEAVSAVKQDIVRSLAARLEMHWDSLVEEEYGSPEEKQTIHEPPRRVLVNLPESKIAFSDYLFPGEGASEVLLSFQELLDMTVSEGNVHKEFEIQRDSADFYGKSISIESSSSDDMLGPVLPTRLLIAAFSLAVILISIAIALHLQRNNENGKVDGNDH